MVLSCLTDDVVWHIYGHATITGKEDFDAAIEGDGSMGSPELTVHRLIEEGDSVVLQGIGRRVPQAGEPIEFVFAEVFTFRDELVCVLETYHVNLP